MTFIRISARPELYLFTFNFFVMVLHYIWCGFVGLLNSGALCTCMTCTMINLALTRHMSQHIANWICHLDLMCCDHFIVVKFPKRKTIHWNALDLHTLQICFMNFFFLITLSIFKNKMVVMDKRIYPNKFIISIFIFQFHFYLNDFFIINIKIMNAISCILSIEGIRIPK